MYRGGWSGRSLLLDVFILNVKIVRGMLLTSVLSNGSVTCLFSIVEEIVSRRSITCIIMKKSKNEQYD